MNDLMGIIILQVANLILLAINIVLTAECIRLTHQKRFNNLWENIVSETITKIDDLPTMESENEKL